MARNAKKEKKTDMKKVMHIIGVVLVFLAVFAIFSFLFQSWGKIDYKGLSFTKESYGNILTYHYYYFFKDEHGQVYKNNIYLRNDPRKNLVPREGEIFLIRNFPLYVGVNTTRLGNCSDFTLALPMLSSFLGSNLFETHGGFIDADEAAAHNSTYVTCRTHPSSSVILIQEGNATTVTRTAENCYKISIANCELTPAVEKFIVESIIDAKWRQHTPQS